MYRFLGQQIRVKHMTYTVWSLVPLERLSFGVPLHPSLAGRNIEQAF